MTVTETPPSGGPGGEQAKLTMGIDAYEKNWMRLSAALLVVFFATVTIGGFAMGFQLSGVEGEVDPVTLLDAEPWSEPGLREIAPGEYEAYVVAQVWAFVPRELEVPVGSKVTIYVSSSDLQHGFKITDTNVNMQIVPGQVSKVVYTFDKVGEFPYICHEYCGRGHATMFGVVNVVPAVAGPDSQNPDSQNPGSDGAGAGPTIDTSAQAGEEASR